jgi:hypothetical protein
MWNVGVTTSRMLMPEATVDEDHFAPAGKHDVRRPREIAAINPEAVAEPMRHSTD